MKKKLNFINWLRQQSFTDTTKKSLIDKHVAKVQRYVDPINLVSGNVTDINVARIAKSMEKLPQDEKLQRQQEILKMQQDAINGEQK